MKKTGTGQIGNSQIPVPFMFVGKEMTFINFMDVPIFVHIFVLNDICDPICQEPSPRHAWQHSPPLRQDRILAGGALA